MKRGTAVTLTIVAAILCGCPGLLGMCWGALSAVISFIPGAQIDIGGSSDPSTALWTGVGSLCGGILLIAIPIVIGMVTLRKKKAKAVVEATPEEPLPPAA